MHIRVLLSKYRAYTECLACLGTRLKPEALLWKIEGKSIHDLMLLPISTDARVSSMRAPRPLDEATDLLLNEIRTRLRYLCDVGLGYLTLDRQSRTLSGGEVQRINLTTALGTSLVNTLFVLDEPSIGLHPRDMGRVIDVMKRLRDAGNYAGRGRARPADHVRRRPHPRHGPGAGRARRRDRVLRPAREAAGRRTRSPPSICPAASAPTRAAHAAPSRAQFIADPGRRRAQPEEHRRAHPAASAWCASPASRARASRRWCRTCSTRRCASPRASRPRRRARTAR